MYTGVGPRGPTSGRARLQGGDVETSPADACRRVGGAHVGTLSTGRRGRRRPVWLAWCLLPRHDDAHLGFVVFNQVAAHIHRHAVERSRESERRFVVRYDSATAVGAAHDASAQTEA